MDVQIHYRACNLCEAICGLDIKHLNGQVVSIAGDKEDPFSRGHICPKAVALKDVYEDPDRLRKPQKKVVAADGGVSWAEIGWEQAFREVTDRLRAIRAESGPNAIGFYGGNPSVHNSGTLLCAPGFIKALRTRTIFSASSVDQYPHHFAAWQLFGHPALLPVPDIDRTDLWIIIGGNPIASNGSIMTAPDVANRLKAIQKRGGNVIVIDPRRTETALRADAHHFIRPGTDVYLLLAMAQVLFAENLVRLGRLASIIDGLDRLRDAVADFTPERVAGVTGIAADTIRQLTRDFAQAERAALYGRVGVSVQSFGSLCLWLINVLNTLTGHLDEPGGMMFSSPAFDIVGKRQLYAKHNRYRSRVSGYPEFMSELPVSCLAEEILTPARTEGEQPIRAMVTSCGNPVLSTPNGGQLDTALGQLDFMVSVDIYRNETTRHADYILPPATGLETAHYDLTFHALAIRNTSRYSDPMVPKPDGMLYDWEIYEYLRLYLEDEQYDQHTGPQPENPEQKIDLALRYGRYKDQNLSVQTLRDNPHGIDLGPLQSQLPDRLMTASNRIDVATAPFLTDLDRARKNFDWLAANTDDRTPPQLHLISRRHLRDNNSWLHNAYRLVKGPNRCTLQINPVDAARLAIADGQKVRVASRVGRVELSAEVTTDMMPGVVSMPHGYGHNRPGIRLGVAQAHAGVSINDLTDETLLDALSGNAALTGVAVTVSPVAVPELV
ncbi:molybdopterin oxidoreductase family protein [Spirosoma spitsbergense]|uniref:molybdopterin oxidoreductase family protein n=1 Tax=Spirosoma spitsbergense TaxID=431554 RepID=UPI000367959D|nr:molybdopterin oxidoreductase family protein [Spirosoma spitsbergense]